MIAAGDLEKGRLIEVGRGNPAFQPYAQAVYRLIARNDRWDAPLIRSFRQWLVADLEKELPRLHALANA